MISSRYIYILHKIIKANTKKKKKNKKKKKTQKTTEYRNGRTT
jgi:hypothetical protein